jgi:hypothetical protein
MLVGVGSLLASCNNDFEGGVDTNALMRENLLTITIDDGFGKV